MFLKDVREINLSLSEFAEIAGYSKNMTSIKGCYESKGGCSGKACRVLVAGNLHGRKGGAPTGWA